MTYGRFSPPLCGLNNHFQGEQLRMSTEEQTTQHRNPDGTFASGNKYGTGRPRKERNEYLDVMYDTVDTEAWEEICKTAIRQAIDGDPRARQWISDYVMGKPTYAGGFCRSPRNGIFQILYSSGSH